MMKRRWLITAAALLTILLSTGIVQAQAGGRSIMDWLVVRRLTVGTGDITAQDDATITDDLAVGDDATVTGDVTANTLTASTMLEASEQTGITLTTGSVLTPTGSSQPIRSAGTINFGAISGCAAAAAGQLMVVINDTATTINITDSATLRLTGNLALGQFDTLLLYCDGLTWVQLGTANN